MVAAADPARAVGGSQQRVDFGPRQEGDEGALTAFGRDGEYLFRGAVGCPSEQVNQWPSMSVNRSRTPDEGCSMRTANRIPAS